MLLKASDMKIAALALIALLGIVGASPTYNKAGNQLVRSIAGCYLRGQLRRDECEDICCPGADRFVNGCDCEDDVVCCAAADGTLKPASNACYNDCYPTVDCGDE